MIIDVSAIPIPMYPSTLLARVKLPSVIDEELAHRRLHEPQVTRQLL